MAQITGAAAAERQPPGRMSFVGGLVSQEALTHGQDKAIPPTRNGHNSNRWLRQIGRSVGQPGSSWPGRPVFATAHRHDICEI